MMRFKRDGLFRGRSGGWSLIGPSRRYEVVVSNGRHWEIDGSISNRIRLSMLLCGHPGVKHGIQNIHPKTRSNNYNARERRDFPWEGGKSCLISHEPPYTIPIHYCSETRPPVEYFPSPQMLVTSLVLRDGGCRLIRSASMAGRRAREDYTASSHSALIWRIARRKCCLDSSLD